MAKIRRWDPSLEYYEEVVAVECCRQTDVECLIDVLWTSNLRTCPHDIIGKSIVIPKKALRFLPLRAMSHKVVEFRSSGSLSTVVQEEIDRRYASTSVQPRPHYYLCGSGGHRTLSRCWIRLSTIRQIEQARCCQ